MKKPITSTALSGTLTLSECGDGFWLYDTTRGMNLAMRAKTAVAACVEAITYYQERYAELSAEHVELSAKVDSFLKQFPADDDS